MIDYGKIGEYRESDRLEAKLALGGLPESIWETYSAFANTLGGVILLGVEEYPDRSLHPVDLPYPHEMIDEFLTQLNDGKRANENILSPEDITIREIDGKNFISIRVPQAPLWMKPVYIGRDAAVGSYYRYGDGDYRFSPEEVRAMQQIAEKIRPVCSGK
ncbi:MAG: ATP-binding protein [Ruminococcaceae bacterium]|nr:ATP-binding protein [Oscillospiraceae bacterium]